MHAMNCTHLVVQDQYQEGQALQHCHAYLIVYQRMKLYACVFVIAGHVASMNPDRRTVSGTVMSHLFLEAKRKIPTVDVVMSLKPSASGKQFRVRDFYQRWLHFWPIGLGSLIFYLDPDNPANDVLKSCLSAACSEFSPQFGEVDYFAHFAGVPQKATTHRTPEDSSMRNPWKMNFWKYGADQLSNAAILAFNDDDAVR